MMGKLQVRAAQPCVNLTRLRRLGGGANLPIQAVPKQWYTANTAGRLRQRWAI